MATDTSAAYTARLPLLESLAATLQERVGEALDDVAHIDRVSFRAKDLDSFDRKVATGKYANALSEIEDQVGGRVITFFTDDLSVVRERLEALFGTVEHVVKEPAGPAEFGYLSEHFIFVIAEHHKPAGWSSVEEMPRTFEMQVRTIFMHAWAEPQHDIAYKAADRLDDDTRRELAWIAASAWGADRMLNDVWRRLDPSAAGSQPEALPT